MHPCTIGTTSASFTTSQRWQRAFAAVRGANGVLAAAALDDTGSIVPAGGGVRAEIID